MTNQQVLIESHVLLCKPNYKTTGVDELDYLVFIKGQC